MHTKLIKRLLDIQKRLLKKLENVDHLSQAEREFIYITLDIRFKDLKAEFADSGFACEYDKQVNISAQNWHDAFKH